MKAKSVKCVDYSYPTSANAARFGFPRGCWTVNLTRLTKTSASTETVAGFATFEEARAHAETLPNEWASWYLRHHANGRVAVHEAMSLAVGQKITDERNVEHLLVDARNTL